MSYKITREVRKRESDIWFLEVNVATSIDPIPDPRDPHIYNESEIGIMVKYVKKLKEDLTDYVGWTREYIGDNQLNFNYFFDTELSARTYYDRATLIPPLPETEAAKLVHKIKVEKEHIDISYTNTWKLFDSEGNELEL